VRTSSIKEEASQRAPFDDSGIDRGSGFLWDLYIEGKADGPTVR
jgi:hypothetical protein